MATALCGGARMRYERRMRRGLRLPSARVIAIGRLMLATLFMLSLWLDISQPVEAVAAIYVLLGAYVAVSVSLLIATWSSWWLDAKLAGPAHAFDILLFTLLVIPIEGYTSPYFALFMFILLAAAIRWGWRATTLTAVLLCILYLLTGLLIIESRAEADLQIVAIGAGHLVILSLILIWFGIHRWQSGVAARDTDGLAAPSLDESPLETGLRATMESLGAHSGVFVWREGGGSEASILAVRDGELSAWREPQPAGIPAIAGSFLYDFSSDRALARDERRNLLYFAPGDRIAGADATLELSEGLAIPVHSGTGEGELFLERLPQLFIDHIDLGEQIAADVAAHIQQHALLSAIEEAAEGRSRLSLARDLHDSVVQFLAGAAFRLEAMKRTQPEGSGLEPQLNELKQMMLHEQGELRSFISALRSGPQISIDELAKDLSALAERLSRQWNVNCTFAADSVDLMIPTRLHLDVHQMMREAVANAVRHAAANSVKIVLWVVADELRLKFINDGTRYPGTAQDSALPWSLKERVEQLGGTLDLSRGMGVTRVTVALPVGGRSV